MHWVESLTQADDAQLAHVMRTLSPPAFEVYLLLTMSSHLTGPLDPRRVKGWLGPWRQHLWQEVAPFFTLGPDGCYHVGDEVPVDIPVESRAA